MQKFKYALMKGCLFLFTIWCLPAYATNDGVPIAYGSYAELNGGVIHFSNKSYPGPNSTNGFGGNLNLGYKFMPFFAGELGYSLYPTGNIKLLHVRNAASDQHYSYNAALKGVLPLNSVTGITGIEIFAKVGVDQIVSHFQVKKTIPAQTAAFLLGVGNYRKVATGIYTGVGVQYYIQPELAAVLQWARANGNSRTGSMDLYSIGFSYIFDF